MIEVYSYYYIYFAVGLAISYGCFVVMNPTEKQIEYIKKYVNTKGTLEKLEEMWETNSVTPAIAYIVCFLIIFLWPIFIVSALTSLPEE